MSARIEWDGLDALYGRIEAYRKQSREALRQVAEYWKPVIEAEAKANAPWTDRTGNARQGLTGLVDDISETMVAILLVHKVDYGVHLELAYQGRYAIIMPTLEAHYKPVIDMVRQVYNAR